MLILQSLHTFDKYRRLTIKPLSRFGYLPYLLKGNYIRISPKTANNMDDKYSPWEKGEFIITITHKNNPLYRNYIV